MRVLPGQEERKKAEVGRRVRRMIGRLVEKCLKRKEKVERRLGFGTSSV